MVDLRLAHSVVNRFRGHIPSWLPFEDAESAAVLGYIKAQRKNNGNRGTTFSTFAVPYIKGAIFDEARRWKWFPRRDRDMATISLDEPRERDGVPILDTLQSHERNPKDVVADREFISKVTGVLGSKEWGILKLHLCYGYTLSEIGEVYGIQKQTCGDHIARSMNRIRQEAARFGFQPEQRQKRCLRLSEEMKKKVHDLAIKTSKSVRQICIDAGCRKSSNVDKIIREARKIT